METSEELLQRLDVLESEGAIRRLMAEYLDARDLGIGGGTHIARLFSADGIWEGVGRLAQVLGSHHGRDAIERRFSAPLPFSVHFLTNESITINGDTAVGTWSISSQRSTKDRQSGSPGATPMILCELRDNGSSSMCASTRCS